MKRLLILSCSATKRRESGPAALVYDGPAYRVLRAWWRTQPLVSKERDPIDVWILSAEHGLIESDTPIARYDRRMTMARAAELSAGVQAQLEELLPRYEEVFVFAGLTYRESCLKFGVLRQRVGSKLRKAEGAGIGEMLADLKRWLQESGVTA